MIHVYLDDMRPCPAGFTLARSAEEGIVLLRDCDVDILSLDYDLGWHAPTAVDIVLWMIAEGRFPRRIYFHTSSSAGREKMMGLLLPELPGHVNMHYGPMPDSVLQEAARREADEQI